MNLQQFHIIDPGLSNHFGHHRALNIEIAKKIQKQGYKVKIWAHQNYQPRLDERSIQDVEIIPHFSINPYAIYDANGIQELIFRNDHSESLFSKELDSINLSGTVHIPNLFSYQLWGVSKIKSAKLTACVHHHPNRYSDHGEMLWVCAWAKSKQRLKHLRVFVVEPFMLNELDRCLDTTDGVQLAPFPLSDSIQPITEPTSTRCIGILGGMRKEQGMQYLKKTIEVIHRFDLDVLLQDVNNTFKDIIPLHRIKRVGYADNMGDLMALCDVLILNYDPTAYRFMGSGIFWEAAGSGVPMLYTRGTAMSSTARRYGLGLSFVYGSPSSLGKAIGAYLNQQRQLRSRAISVAHTIRSTHGLDGYCQKMIED